jgi:hypothetical protein
VKIKNLILSVFLILSGCENSAEKPPWEDRRVTLQWEVPPSIKDNYDNHFVRARFGKGYVYIFNNGFQSATSCYIPDDCLPEGEKIPLEKN